MRQPLNKAEIRFLPLIKQEDKFNLKRTKMSYWNAIKLSFTNIMTKKGRTLLTAFASSIGIISIAVVLAISNGFQKQINIFQIYGWKSIDMGHQLSF